MFVAAGKQPVYSWIALLQPIWAKQQCVAVTNLGPVYFQHNSMWATVGLDPINHAQRGISLVNGVVRRTVAFIETLWFMFEGPDLTHILTALSEKHRKSFSAVEPIGYSQYGFQFVPCFLQNYISSITSTYTFQTENWGSEEENLLNCLYRKK